jgi:hypothetical protein
MDGKDILYKWLKKARVVMVTADKIELKTKNITNNKGHFMQLKGPIH